MNIPAGFEKFKVDRNLLNDHRNDENKKFFTLTTPECWGFSDFLEDSDVDKTELKYIKYAYDSYFECLDWLITLPVPREIKKYVASLNSKEQLSSMQLKNLLHSANNNKDVSNSSYTISAVNSNIQIGNNNKLNVEEGSSSGKRKSDKEERITAESERRSKATKMDASFFADWLLFLESSENEKKFGKYSPERNGVIRCGKGVSPRPNLPRDLYKNYNIQEEDDGSSCIVENLKDYIKSVIDSEDIEELEDNIRCFSAKNIKIKKDFYFLQDAFLGALRMYNSNSQITKQPSEAVFNGLIFPILYAAALTNNSALSVCEFIPAETQLLSMDTQLKKANRKKDERDRYLADGIMRVKNMKYAEILLLETSGPFRNKDKIKRHFDHHKGMFGCLAMIKTIADSFSFANIEVFQKLSIVFVHAADEAINLWLIKFKYDEERSSGFYEMRREKKLEIKENFEDKDDYLYDLVGFSWHLKETIKKNLNVLQELKNSHDKNKSDYFLSGGKGVSVVLLDQIVNPAITKLTQKQHSKGMGEEGPFSSPEQEDDY